MFPATEARLVRFVIHTSDQGEPCIDELEVYGADANRNLALASAGAKASASSLLPGYAIHQIPHLNDGLYGNSHSWIAAGTIGEWAQIELPQAARVARVVFSRDREGRYRDRLPTNFEVQLSMDGQTWQTLAERDTRPVTTISRPLPAAGPVKENDLLRYAFACEEATWHKAGASDSFARVADQMEQMLSRFAAKGLDVSQERLHLAELHRRGCTNGLWSCGSGLRYPEGVPAA